MNTATEAKENLVNQIQVGSICFEGWNWREALMSYLRGLWAGSLEEMIDQPTINFAVGDRWYSFALKFDPETKQYCNDGWIYANEFMACYQPDLAGSNKALDVEAGLIRFVKNDRIMSFHIYWDSHVLRFWKTPGERSQLRISTSRRDMSSPRYDVNPFLDGRRV